LINKELQVYIEKKIHARNELIHEIEMYAQAENVPIMELIGIEALLQILRIHNPRNILEIGAAIGYSAIRMSLVLPKVKIVTVERDEQRAQLAENYIDLAGKSSDILLIKGDALEVEEIIKPYGPFDAIFIDAAKGQYLRFFEIYSQLLNENGIIITDNILFKGLVSHHHIENRRVRSLVKKIDGFNTWLMNHPDYDTAILPVGDGIAISKKR
jgi:predicted O-methyltransferase YrrM